MKTLDRYLAREMLPPFVFGVTAFVLLFVSANVLFKLTELITELGISLWTASELFLLSLPEYAVYTFPLATLVAILVTFGRLSGDSELVAMHAGGVSFRRLCVPMVVVGLVVSLATVALNEYVVPASKRRAEEIVRAAGERAGRAAEESVFLKEMAGDEVARLVYADRLDVVSGEMVRPTIVWFEGGRPVMATMAERGRWQGEAWELFEGSTKSLAPDQLAGGTFERLVVALPTSPREMAEQARPPGEMTYRELREYIRLALMQKRPTAEAELILHHRLSIPFACLVFALIAPPLGMRSHRGASSVGMGIAILVGFAYYVVWHYLAIMAAQNALTPFWAAWLPNIVTAGVGVGLIVGVRK